MSTVIKFSDTANISQLQTLIEKHNVRFIDLRFTDLLGKEQHVTIPSHIASTGLIETGKMFDGSSIKGWQSIDKSDLIMKPDLSTATLDPFCKIPTLLLSCDIMNPDTQKAYSKDPRSTAQRAEEYLKSTGIADTSNIGPEPEFFIFDKVLWRNEIGNSFYRVESKEAAWNSDKEYEDGSLGHHPAVKGGYFPVPPVDSSHGIRSDMCTILESVGIIVEAHHHEVATCNQNEITFRYSNLLNTADQFQLFKYIVMNVAHNNGKTVTFMPKPLVGDNGSGMHCHQSLSKNGENLFVGDEYGGLSQLALHYIGGIIKHAGALSAFTNPTTNSYKRLVPGFEAPTLLTYSARNRSAAIRLPHVHNRNEVRIEVRFPDATINPYLAFSAMLMAGIDGIKNKIDPGEPVDKDLFTADADEISELPTIPASLEEAMGHLTKDHDFLLQGDVFTSELIESYIALKQTEILRYRAATHPIEFEMYYSS